MSSAGIEARPNLEGWLFGRRTDLMIGCGLGYILSVPLLYYVSLISGTARWPELMMLVFVLLMNSPHYGATIVRVYDAREDRRKYAVFSVYITLALVFLSVASVRDVWLASVVTTAYLTWSPWHFSGQNYGLMLMFLRRRGIEVDSTTKRLAYGSFLFSAALAIMAVHAGHEDLVFAPRTIHAADTPTIMYISMPTWLAAAVVPAAILAYLGCLAGVAWRLRRSRLRDLTPALVLVLTQALWFAIPAITLNWDVARRTRPHHC